MSPWDPCVPSLGWQLSCGAGQDFCDPLVAWCSARGGGGCLVHREKFPCLGSQWLENLLLCEGGGLVRTCLLALGQGLTKQAVVSVLGTVLAAGRCRCQQPGWRVAGCLEPSPVGADVCGISPPSLQMPANEPGLAILSLGIGVCSCGPGLCPPVSKTVSRCLC